MENPVYGPRKQRTRQHVIADLSVHYVEGFILEEGHTAQRLSPDYSYDLVMRTFDEEGYAERGPRRRHSSTQLRSENLTLNHRRTWAKDSCGQRDRAGE